MKTAQEILNECLPQDTSWDINVERGVQNAMLKYAEQFKPNKEQLKIIIDKWQSKHSIILSDYSKGNKNNEVMILQRLIMKYILEFIDDLKNGCQYQN